MIENGSKPFVSVHIEKTAGSSIGQLLVKKYGKEGILRYDAVSDTIIRLSDRIVPSDSSVHKLGELLVGIWGMKPFLQLGQLVVRNIDRTKQHKPEEIPTGFAVLTGHFRAERFIGILPPEEFRYTSVLREPLARMWSHYQHWNRTCGIPRFRVRPTYNPDMRFEDFAMLPEMAGYQAKALGENTEEFSNIGVVDHLMSYLEEMGWHNHREVPPRINTGNYAAMPTLDPGFYRDFLEAHSADFELYETTKSQWQ